MILRIDDVIEISGGPGGGPPGGGPQGGGMPPGM